MSRRMMFDPPSGWKYGFPKILPENVDMRKFLLVNGYPEKDISLAMEYYRCWEVETKHCYQCDAEVVHLFADGRCSKCTKIEPDDQ